MPQPTRQPAQILTIAGSDSGGGAGIQADLKAVAMLGGYGMSVITALTAQNSRGVTGIEAPTPGFVALQLATVLEDFRVAAAKTGMLFSAPIVHAVADGLADKTFPLVVDPVCVSQSGHRLLKEDAVDALRRRMLPLADLLTPNRPEAELLAGMEIASPGAAREAVGRLLDMGARAVLLKGGHFAGEHLEGPGAGRMADLLGLADGTFQVLDQPRVDTAHTHGTGCTLSAASPPAWARPGAGPARCPRPALSKPGLRHALARASGPGPWPTAAHGPAGGWGLDTLDAAYGGGARRAGDRPGSRFRRGLRRGNRPGPQRPRRMPRLTQRG
jgi:hydroxymethylpyrimidine/phosphomethylpyrimidine kinase